MTSAYVLTWGKPTIGTGKGPSPPLSPLGEQHHNDDIQRDGGGAKPSLK